MIDQQHLKAVSEETLANFEAIASVAEKKLKAGSVADTDALVPSNTFPDGQAKAQQRLSAINAANMHGYQELTMEPAICRVMALDEEGERHTYRSPDMVSGTFETRLSLNGELQPQ